MTFEFYVARRYLLAERRGLLAFVTTAIGVAGVTIGVAALIATLSVMNGFQSDIQRKIIGAHSHLTITGDLGPEGLRRVQTALARAPGVAATAPFVIGQAILSVRGRSMGIVFKGIDPGREMKVSELHDALTSGSWQALQARGSGKASQAPAVLLGEELARNLGVWGGDPVMLVSPQGVETPLGIVPRTQSFTVAGTVKTGYYEYDANFAYMHIEDARRFLGLKNAAGGLAIRLQDLSHAEDLARRLQAELGFSFSVRTFAQMNRTLFAALRLEKAVMFIILALIVLVATFNIASNLLVLSSEKARDIGILRSLGLTRAGTRRLFVWVGSLIGGVGVACGTGLGIAASWFIGRYPLVELPADIYYVSRVPVDIQTRDVIAVALTAVVLCVLATLYPAHRAACMDPVEAIHYG